MSKVAVIGIVGNSVFMPVEEFHKGGETVVATDIHFEWGGKGCNQAVAASRMGVEVAFLAAVGVEDKAKIAEFLHAERIQPVLITKSTPSAFATILTDRHGTNHVTVYHGAKLAKEDVSAFEAHIRTADILLINNEVDEEVNLEATKLAQKYGVKIVLNPAPYRKTDKVLLDRVSIFTPNEHEAEGLEGYTGIIQTLGGRGCWIKAEDKIIPAMPVQAVDTTGAGDTFNGTLCAELAMGATLTNAVQTAVRASGYSVTKRGVMSSIPYRKDL